MASGAERSRTGVSLRWARDARSTRNNGNAADSAANEPLISAPPAAAHEVIGALRARRSEASGDVSIVLDFLVETMLNLSAQLLGQLEEVVDRFSATETLVEESEARSDRELKRLAASIDNLSAELERLGRQVAVARREAARPISGDQLLAIAEAVVDEVERRRAERTPSAVRSRPRRS